MLLLRRPVQWSIPTHHLSQVQRPAGTTIRYHLDPDVDSDVWMQLLSVFEPSTTPTSLIQENALTTERSMRDPRATDAFATQELLNALPQFREEEGNYGPFYGQSLASDPGGRSKLQSLHGQLLVAISMARGRRDKRSIGEGFEGRTRKFKEIMKRMALPVYRFSWTSFGEQHIRTAFVTALSSRRWWTHLMILNFAHASGQLR